MGSEGNIRCLSTAERKSSVWALDLFLSTEQSDYSQMFSGHRSSHPLKIR